MDKKIINKEQFRKLVIEHADQYINNSKVEDSKKEEFSFDSVEKLINEIKEKTSKRNTISELAKSSVSLIKKKLTVEKEVVSENRKGKTHKEIITYNLNKASKYVNESEKDKWNRMIKYEVPSDKKR